MRPAQVQVHVVQSRLLHHVVTPGELQALRSLDHDESSRSTESWETDGGTNQQVNKTSQEFNQKKSDFAETEQKSTNQKVDHLQACTREPHLLSCLEVDALVGSTAHESNLRALTCSTGNKVTSLGEHDTGAYGMKGGVVWAELGYL